MGDEEESSFEIAFTGDELQFLIQTCKAISDEKFLDDVWKSTRIYMLRPTEE